MTHKNQTSILDKLKDGTATNEDIAVCLGWKAPTMILSGGCVYYIESGMAVPVDKVPLIIEAHLFIDWRGPDGRYWNTSQQKLPNWIGNTDKALTLIPDGWVVFGMTNDPVSVEDRWLVTLRKIDHDKDVESFTLMDDTNKELSRAIIGAVFQIKELH